MNVSKIISLRSCYVLTLIVMIVMFPIFVSDGHNTLSFESARYFPPYEQHIHGIDISKHNGEIEWKKVQGHRWADEPFHFTVIKATEGGDLVDAYFRENWKKAREHGFVRGAYHFFTSFTDPEIQAINYLSTVKHEVGDFVPVLDFENDGRTHGERKNLAQNAKVWLKIVEEQTGKKPIIYTNHKIYHKYIKEHLPEYDLWLADYSVYDPSHYQLNKLIMWQLSDGGVVPGIPHAVDLNVFYGSHHKFQKYLF